MDYVEPTKGLLSFYFIIENIVLWASRRFRIAGVWENRRCFIVLNFRLEVSGAINPSAATWNLRWISMIHGNLSGNLIRLMNTPPLGVGIYPSSTDAFFHKRPTVGKTPGEIPPIFGKLSEYPCINPAYRFPWTLRCLNFPRPNFFVWNLFPANNVSSL